MEESSVLVAELRRQKGFRYSPELKARVGAFIRASRASGKTWRAIHEELGLPKETVRRWSDLPVESRKLQPVRAASPSSPTTLVSPKGWRLEGVDTAVASELFRALAR